jgi:hypothetical protein
MTKKQEIQRLFKHYREVTGKIQANLHDVVKFAIGKGWPLPAPIDPLDRLAKEFSQALREEIRHDKETGRPYRANHSVTFYKGEKQTTLWGDIEEIPRRFMLKSAVMRREQMVGEGLQLTLDLDHWNRIHHDEEQIKLPMDLTDDIEWRKNAPKEDQRAS